MINLSKQSASIKTQSGQGKTPAKEEAPHTQEYWEENARRLLEGKEKVVEILADQGALEAALNACPEGQQALKKVARQMQKQKNADRDMKWWVHTIVSFPVLLAKAGAQAIWIVAKKTAMVVGFLTLGVIGKEAAVSPQTVQNALKDALGHEVSGANRQKAVLEMPAPFIQFITRKEPQTENKTTQTVKAASALDTRAPQLVSQKKAPPPMPRKREHRR